MEQTRLRAVSICLTDLLEHARAAHPAFSRSAKNKKIYVNLAMWDQEEAKFGSDVGVQLSPPANSEATKDYVGNGKRILRPAPEPLGATSLAALPESDDDLPF